MGATSSGTVLAVQPRAGSPTLVTLAPDATVREREAAGDWLAVSLRDLKPGEPVTIELDAGGRGRSIDAEYARVMTRAVVVQDGYLIGTDGVARRLVGVAATTTGAASGSGIPLGSYVALRTDPATGDVFDFETSSRPFAGAAVPAVAVTFEVRVPVNTPASSTVYLTTNAQSWTANAIRMAPEPGNRWSATMSFAAGTVLQYKYTRGSWATVEKDASGSDIPNRSLTVARDKNAQPVADIVVRWADLPL